MLLRNGSPDTIGAIPIRRIDCQKRGIQTAGCIKVSDLCTGPLIHNSSGLHVNIDIGFEDKFQRSTKNNLRIFICGNRTEIERAPILNFELTSQLEFNNGQFTSGLDGKRI